MPLPKLRPVDAFPVGSDGRTQFVLRDPEGLAAKAVVLSAADYVIAAHLDGKADAPAVQAAIARRFGGAAIPVERIERLARLLDENFFLESRRFKERVAKLEADFKASPSRPAAHAGAVYAASGPELARELDAFFPPPCGPGPARGGERGALVGLVAPHIDFRRGKTAYAWAYQEILKSGLADLYVILGVAHASPPTPFVATAKNYDTPLGPAAADGALAAELARLAPYDIFSDELVHRTEHSVEFQAVFLRYAGKKLGDDFKVLPLLCSSRGRRHAPAVLKGLAALLKNYPGTVCLLAGADLAHVGPRFGDKEAVSEKMLAWVEEEDRNSLGRVLALDAEGFYRSVTADGDRRKVCGLNALHAFAWLMRELHPGARGELLHYGHAPDPAGGEVSFASLAFRASSSI